MQSKPNRLLVSVAEAADLLSIGLTKTWQLIKIGDLEVRRLGGRTLVTMASIRRLAGAEADDAA